MDSEIEMDALLEENKNAPENSANKIQYPELIRLILDLGEHMIACGGEVSRVEETVSRICSAYGAVRVDVFCITSVIIVTTIWENGDIITQSRRVAIASRNYNKLEKLNALSRYMCEKKPSIEETENKMRAIVSAKNQSIISPLIGSMLAAGGFAVFFGGRIIDGIAAMICSLVIFAIDKFVYNNRVNKVVYYMLSSFVTGLVAILTVKLGIGINLDKIMIGCIMLIIPGINFTLALEDVLSGDTATGALRIYESVLLACAIALGFAMSIYICGGSDLM